MARIFVTGSVEGLGRSAAETLIADGHELVVHARNDRRADTLDDLVAMGAHVVVGDLARMDHVQAVAEGVNRLGKMDAVIHNAGVDQGLSLLPVNVVAPFLLTALIDRPARLVYLSSGMHRGGRADLTDADWSGARRTHSYSDSKLFVTALAFFVARTWPEVLSNAVDPGWVPTRMGGAAATDDLRLGHVTQAWLAGSDAPETQVTGRYWFHKAQQQPAPAAQDEAFQEGLVDALARYTGVTLP